VIVVVGTLETVVAHPSGHPCKHLKQVPAQHPP